MLKFYIRLNPGVLKPGCPTRAYLCALVVDGVIETFSFDNYLGGYSVTYRENNSDILKRHKEIMSIVAPNIASIF